MKVAIKILFVMFSVSWLFACEGVETEVFKKNAVLIWQGEFSENGCGFILVIDNQEFKPRNEEYMDQQFKSVAEMEVEVDFYLLYEIVQYRCGGNPQVEEREGIEIVNIELINNEKVY